MTKGGVMMGSKERDLKNPRKRAPVRVSTRANAKPSSVDNKPTTTPSTRVFQAAPQLEPVLRQLSRHILWSPRRSKNGANDQPPASVLNGNTSICTSGRPINSRVRAITSPSEPAIKASPPTRPRSAMPRVNKNKKLRPVSSAPQPMPNWRCSDSPSQAVSQAAFQPCKPNKKPWASK